MDLRLDRIQGENDGRVGGGVLVMSAAESAQRLRPRVLRLGALDHSRPPTNMHPFRMPFMVEKDLCNEHRALENNINCNLAVLELCCACTAHVWTSVGPRLKYGQDQVLPIRVASVVSVPTISSNEMPANSLETLLPIRLNQNHSQRREAAYDYEPSVA